MNSSYEVVIVGAGPAGLSAALILGRSCRSVLVCDDGRPRNGVTRTLHGFLSRDGVPPLEFIGTSREQLAPYSVDFSDQRVQKISGSDGDFYVHLEAGTVKAQKILLATGIEDVLLKVKGFEEFYGQSIFHCPYCDCWEAREQKIAVYGKGLRGVEFVQTIRQWSKDIFLCTDGYPLSRKLKKILDKAGIRYVQSPIECFKGKDGQVESVEFWDGSSESCSFVFFTAGQRLNGRLARELGCRITEDEFIRVNKEKESSVKGVFAAGDCTRDVHLAIAAAGEGAKAAFFINKSLLAETSVLQ